MARAWINDLWLKNDASPAARRALNAARSPERANVPEQHRTARYGRGLRWRVGWISPDGKRHSKAVASKGEAEALKAALEDDIRAGRYQAPTDRTRTFRQAAEEFLSSKHKVKQSTLNLYRGYWRTYVFPRWGDMPLIAITEADINTWIRNLQDGIAPYDFRPTTADGKTRQPTPLGTSSIKQIVSVAFGAVLRYAADSRRAWMANNPMDGIELPRTHAQADAMVFLTYGEVEQLAQAAPTAMDATMIRFLSYVGCRVGEAAALTIDDLDFENHRASISKTWTEDRDGKPVLGVTKTWERRTVAWPGFLDDELRVVCDGHAGTDFVFRSHGGQPINLANWRNRVFNVAVAGAGLDVEGLTPKALRHTFASLAVASGADVKTIQKQLGHRDAAMTLNVYATLYPDRLDEVMDTMDQARIKALES